MAVQFNLLPDVKLEFDRQQRTKRLVYTLSFLTMGTVFAIFVISFFSVNVLQAKLLSDAQGDIDSYSKKLKNIPDLDKVLTVQNQLNSLPTMHGTKHYTSRLFAYLPQLTQPGLHVGKLSVDYSTNGINIDGTADSIEQINTFIDTLKFTTYTVDGDESSKKPAFNNVLLSKVDRSAKNATYTIDAFFDPVLFASTKDIKLVIPQKFTTRSILNTPNTSDLLFNGETSKPDDSSQGGSQ